jgi:hypothetical protein
MMKKLLVLMLVVGMGSLASAGYILEQTADDVATITGDGEMGAYAIVLSGPGTADVVLNYAGDMSARTEYIDVPDMVAMLAMITGVSSDDMTSALLMEYVDGPDDQGNTIAPMGLVTTITGTAFPVTVSLVNAGTLEFVGQVTLVPEPVSMILLGLGGLFLRRRK